MCRVYVLCGVNFTAVAANTRGRRRVVPCLSPPLTVPFCVCIPFLPPMLPHTNFSCRRHNREAMGRRESSKQQQLRLMLLLPAHSAMEQQQQQEVMVLEKQQQQQLRRTCQSLRRLLSHSRQPRWGSWSGAIFRVLGFDAASVENPLKQPRLTPSSSETCVSSAPLKNVAY